MKILGVMTGTSCDGLDAACVDFRGEGAKLLWGGAAPYPAALRERVLKMQEPGARLTTRELLEIQRDLGLWYGKTLSAMIARQARARRPGVIASHGQTVAHFPAARNQGTTLQLGEASRIARATGLTVISHFRDGDMAAGGEGAPLLPLFHERIARQALKGKKSAGISIHNLGGISNFSYVRGGRVVLAFDTGPANSWMDEAVERLTLGSQTFDRGGKIALKGRIDSKGVERVLRDHPFFAKQPPKSTGRDDFPFDFLLKRSEARGADLVATATALTAESIARAYERWILKKRLPLARILFCGGGARNPTLLAWIQRRLPKLSVGTTADVGFDPQLIEAQGFAYFGLRALQGRPIGGAWTGARGFAPPAQITPGENWKSVARALSFR